MASASGVPNPAESPDIPGHTVFVTDRPSTVVARPSLASLFIQMSVRGEPLATGTAFAVERKGTRFLITNRHNLSGRRYDDNKPIHRTAATPDTVTIFHNRAGSLGRWILIPEPVVDDDGEPLWLEHPDLGRRVDVVALPLSNLNEVDIYSHDPWATEPGIAAGVTEGVNIVGFPFGITGGGFLGVWSRGFIATEPGLDFQDLPLFLVDSRTRPGQSGSPVVFYREGGAVSMADGSTAFFSGPVERLLGVYSGRINHESDLGFVWKAEAVRRIVEAGVRNSATTPLP